MEDEMVADRGDSKVTFKVPRLVGGRPRATQLVEPQRAKLRDAIVEIDCRDMRSGSPSFADQLVIEVLSDGHARALLVVGGPDRFGSFVKKSAVHHGVTEKVCIESLTNA